LTSDSPGVEFDERHYVPLLLTRQGERLALRDTAIDVKRRLTPLFVVHPITIDPDTEQPLSDVAAHLARLLPQLGKDWGDGRAFIDLVHLDAEQRLADGRHPLTLILAAKGRGMNLVPAVNRAHPADYRAAAAEVVSQLGIGVCFRLTPAEWGAFGTPVGDGALLALLTEFGVAPAEVDLVLDVQAQVTDPPLLTATAVRGALLSLPRIHEWRTLTVAGTAMPSTTADVGPDQMAVLPRNEWLGWRQLLDTPGIPRKPTFGDYGIQHPDPFSDFNPKFMDSSAQLRYTMADGWQIARGRGVKARGYEQIRTLAERIVESDHFAGRDFSSGDEWLAACAEGSCDPGNQGVWRKVGTNHHLAFVTQEIATLVGS
jgi:hypothetical protein